MRARIHRGAKEIGGSCVELEHENSRCVLDLGLPLDVERGAPPVLPPITGLREASPQMVGVIVSHGHPDHAGLVAEIPPQVEVFGPAAANRMQEAARRFVSNVSDVRWFTPLNDQEPVRLGPFTVTPWLVDHSAFESYAILVEAGGRRLFYSGDLRGHGRKPGLWRRLLDDPPVDIHVLLLEGTRLSREDGPNVTERDVEQQIAELCDRTKGLVLVCYSGQNIDRLVSVYRAARRSGRRLVLDLYGAAIAAATERDTIPQANWGGVRVFVPHVQRRGIIEHRAFEEIERIKPKRIYPEQLREQAGRLIVTMRTSMMRDLDRAECLDGAVAVWSMWPGYLREPSGQRLHAWLDRREIPLTSVHSSGHASPADLTTLTDAIKPGRVVPIHTSVPERYGELCDRVEPHDNGEWWEV